MTYYVTAYKGFAQMFDLGEFTATDERDAKKQAKEKLSRQFGADYAKPFRYSVTQPKHYGKD